MATNTTASAMDAQSHQCDFFGSDSAFDERLDASAAGVACGVEGKAEDGESNEVVDGAIGAADALRTGFFLGTGVGSISSAPLSTALTLSSSTNFSLL